MPKRRKITENDENKVIAMIQATKLNPYDNLSQ